MTATSGLAARICATCATRVVDAVQVGRGTVMPSFPSLAGAELVRLTTHLGQLCTDHGRTGTDLYLGNCSTCHGADAGGGRSALGVRGPEIQCTGRNDYQEKVQNGDGRMPAFPLLGTGDVDRIVDWVRASFCP